MDAQIEVSLLSRVCLEGSLRRSLKDMLSNFDDQEAVN
jgi:hypothetical protein